MAGIPGQHSGGASAKTPQQHKLQGTYQKVRHGGYLGPEAPKGVPTPPKPLVHEARREWKRMIHRLSQTGAMSTVDDAELYQYCRLFAATEAAMEEQEAARKSARLLEKRLATLEGPELAAVCIEIAKLRHDIKSYTSELRQSRMALLRHLQEFGLTPASRGRVKLPEPKEADPFEKFGDGETRQ